MISSAVLSRSKLVNPSASTSQASNGSIVTGLGNGFTLRSKVIVLIHPVMSFSALR